MIITTPEFVDKLNHDIQFINTDREPLRVVGSFTRATKYISDIDVSRKTILNEGFVYRLKKMLTSLGNSDIFHFITFNSGTDIRYYVPWKIHPYGGCVFDLDAIPKWLEYIRPLLSEEEYARIYNILNQKSLNLSDLISVERVIMFYSKVRWTYSDIMSEKKVVGDRILYLLPTMKGSDGNVAHFIYKYNAPIGTLYEHKVDYIEVDLCFSNNCSKFVISKDNMYQYYTESIYKILKSYKRSFPKNIEKEYWHDLNEHLSEANAKLARINLLLYLKSYNHNLYNDVLKTSNIDPTSEERSRISTELDVKAIPILMKYLPLISDRYRGKFEALGKLTMLSREKVPIEMIRKRKREGINCPFYSEEREYLRKLSQNTLMNVYLFYNCFYTIQARYNLSVNEMLYSFKDVPGTRLRINRVRGQGKQVMQLYGKLTDKDKKWLKINNLSSNYIPYNKLKILQKYLVTLDK